MKSKSRKTIMSLAVIALAAVAVGFAVYSAFSSTTTNPGNSFATGSVSLTGNNTGSAFYDVSAAKPGDSSTPKCMKVTYTGSLASTVKLYRSAFTGGTGLDQYVTLTITKGPGARPRTAAISRPLGRLWSTPARCRPWAHPSPT